MGELESVKTVRNGCLKDSVLKVLLHRIILLCLVPLLLAVRSFGATYDWVGTSLTNGVYNWNDKLNWQVGGVAASSAPGAADIVRIGVNSFTNNPTITDTESCASLILGIYNNLTLTVNGSLTVSGDITQNNDPDYFQTTTLTGTGTITCNNFNVGDNTRPSAATGVVIKISSQVNQLTINGNLTLNATGNTTNDGIDYPFFSLDANKLTLHGQIYTTTYGNPLSNGVNIPTYPGLGLFQMDSFTSSTTLELLNNNPVVTPITTGFTVDFTNNGSGSGTVIYDAPSGIQTVYTTANAGLGIYNYNYDYITFGGGSTKQINGGALTIGQDLTTGGTGTVDLTTNNPAVTISGNWINNTNVTQGSGAIALAGALQNNSGTITFGSGTFAITGAFQNTGGIVKCGTGNITFKGNYLNKGTFAAGTAMVYFSGTAQTLVDSSANGTTFKQVTFNGGTATIGAGTGNFAISSTGILTMASATVLVAGTSSTAYLTLNSDSTGTATIAPIPASSSITGNVNVQRFLKGGNLIYRGYRLLSSPVYASTVASNNVYSINYLQKSCYITGATGTAGGFDKAGNPTLYLYRENLPPSGASFMSGNFRGVNDITASPTYLINGDAGNFNIPVGDGFLFFFRGDRSTSLASKTTSPYATPENTILTATGTLNQGQITVHDWYTPSSANLGYTTTTGNDTIRGYNLVGNPYASSINWDLFNTTTSTSGIYGSNVRNTIYVLDPISKNFGVYIAGSGGVGTHNTSSILPSGQGFFVIATSPSAQLVFNESAKVNTQVTGNNLLMGMPVDYASNQYLRLQIAADSVNTDDIIIHFNSSATTAYNATVDAPYKQGYGTVSLASMSSDHIALAINTVPLPEKTEMIPLNVNATVSGTYKLNIKDIAAVPAIYGLSLIDKYAHDTVDIRKNSVYSFTINKTDTSSFGGNRFMLVIGQIPANAYQLLTFSATKIPSSIVRQVQLTWAAVNEQNYTNFTVERSIDKGKTYNVIGSIHSSGEGQYGLLDSSPAVGENLYRLAQQGINNSITYSKVITVEYAPLSNGITSNNVNIYPNPVSSVINLAVTAKDTNANASYQIKITNNLGLIVKEFNSSYEQWQGNVSDLITGTYFVQVVNTRDQSLVGKTKFIKL